MSNCRIYLVVVGLLISVLMFGQFRNLPMPTAQRDTVKREIKTWTVDDIYGLADTVVIDSLVTSYQDNQPVNNYSIANPRLL